MLATATILEGVCIASGGIGSRYLGISMVLVEVWTSN